MVPPPKVYSYVQYEGDLVNSRSNTIKALATEVKSKFNASTAKDGSLKTAHNLMEKNESQYAKYVRDAKSCERCTKYNKECIAPCNNNKTPKWILLLDTSTGPRDKLTTSAKKQGELQDDLRSIRTYLAGQVKSTSKTDPSYQGLVASVKSAHKLAEWVDTAKIKINKRVKMDKSPDLASMAFAGLEDVSEPESKPGPSTRMRKRGRGSRLPPSSQ